jgi:hypothetical protein
LGELEKCRRLTHEIPSADQCTFPVFCSHRQLHHAEVEDWFRPKVQK